MSIETPKTATGAGIEEDTASDSGRTETALTPLLRNRDYMLLWSGQMVSQLGSGISQLALPLLVLYLTRSHAQPDGSPAQAGGVAAAFAIPYIVFSLPAGALIDRWNRKRVMILCDIGRAANAASIPIVAALGQLTVPQLYVNTLIEGSLFVFFNLAEVSCLPRVVPKEQLSSAGAQNEGGSIATGLIAPPLGGLIFQVLGRTAPFLFDAVSYAASVISLSFIRASFQGERTAEKRALRVEIAEGLSWLWRQPLIRYMAFLTGGLNFGNAAIGLIAIVAAKNEGAPPAAIGVVFSIASIGGIMGAVAAPRIQRRYRFGQVIIATLWVEAALWPLLIFAPNVVVLGIILGAIFVTGPIYNAVQLSYRLRLIPDRLQGRVNSAFRLLAFGFQPLGAALCGLLLQGLNTAPTILIFSAVVLALALLTTVNAHVRKAGYASEAPQVA